MGLTDAFSDALAELRQRRAGHDPGRVAVDVAVTLADGGEAIADLAVLRDQAELFGAVASDPTAWRLLSRMNGFRTGPSPAPPVGDTPWSVPEPVVLHMTAAGRELDYRPVTGYAESLPGTVEWLVDAARGRDWRVVFPDLAENYRTDFFDYAAEDAWLAGRG